ncbi:uncharacterized protein GO595_006749 [Histomonas meleagridis]|uniref:uncharacterized protein n=1 Tax=Histomonas meleagridis TaxID=135588 RepID=UPI00355A2E05|nr:hypothetical protein GO595_006749 [Histomonas meleagridis]
MEPVTKEIYDAKRGDNNAFLIHLQPLSCKYKCLPLHVLPYKKGNADEDVRIRLRYLADFLDANGFNVRCIASDGDSGYSIIHREQFNKWWPIFRNKGIEDALGILQNDRLIIGDFLHLLKNARSRILNGQISICTDGKLAFTALDMEKVLQLGAPLTDTSPKGRMKDHYCLKIFTMENFFQLLHSSHINMAFYILPYALWSHAIRNSSLSPQTRLDYLCSLLDIFAYHAKNLDRLTPNVQQVKRGHGTQYCCSLNQCIRIMNTLIGVLRELRARSDDLCLERLGTHNVECQFGLIRIMCHNKHSWEKIMSAFSRLTLMNDLTTVIGRKINIRTRMNVGGVKLTEKQGNVFEESPQELTMEQVFEAVNVVMERQAGSEDIPFETAIELCPDLAEFVMWLNRINAQWKVTGVRLEETYQGSLISNCTILARLISFCKNEPINDADLGDEDTKEQQSVRLKENLFCETTTPTRNE